MKNAKVVQQEGNAIPAEVLATSIEAIGKSMAQISKTRLSRKAILTLIADDTKLGKGTVAAVLDSLESLEKTYLKPKTKSVTS